MELYLQVTTQHSNAIPVLAGKYQIIARMSFPLLGELRRLGYADQLVSSFRRRNTYAPSTQQTDYRLTRGLFNFSDPNHPGPFDGIYSGASFPRAQKTSIRQSLPSAEDSTEEFKDNTSYINDAIFLWEQFFGSRFPASYAVAKSATLDGIIECLGEWSMYSGIEEMPPGYCMSSFL